MNSPVRYRVTVALVVAAACRDSSTPLDHDLTLTAQLDGTRPAQVVIAPDNALLESLSETVQLTATVVAANGNVIEAVPVRWSSLDESVATVTSSGLVTARNNGSTGIRAAVGEGTGALSDTAEIVVQQKAVRIVVGTPADPAAGLPIAVLVTIQDALQNPVAGSSLDVTLALQANDQGALLLGTTTVTAVDGIATFDDAQISRAGRGFVLSATAGEFFASSDPFDVRLRLTSVSAGNAMACGLSPLGDAYCWGRNRTGGLGTASTAPRQSRPALVVGNHTFIQLDAGSGTNINGIFDGGGCGLTAEGAVWCWGRNDFGQLGNGTTGVDSRIPVTVAGDIAFQSISVGRDHACGVARAGGAIFCWGSNQHGQLGNNNRGVHSNVPVPVDGGLSYSAVFIGDVRSCALATTGDVYCWGEGGPTILPGSPFVDAPALLTGGLSFAQVDPGTFLHFCGATVSRLGYCWGQDLGSGELGTGTPGQNEAGPALVTGGHEWMYIGANGLNSCGLRVDGRALCWGRDNNGELGQGTLGVVRTVPTPVVGSVAFAQMDVGHGTVCAVTPLGEAYCWGTGFEGERGDGTVAPQQPAPVRIVTP